MKITLQYNILFLLLSISQIYSSSAQNIIKGLVKDSDQLPLPGATVVIKGTQSFGVTDVNGQFNLNGINPPYILQIN
ncbi:MAG TPA: carboxypeptidase-like regulatory domain-containing protein, partial [Anditalea sp.]|nr:carboxypeptidase-like regulatory domain-containing protein [Anditalea sp.]